MKHGEHTIRMAEVGDAGGCALVYTPYVAETVISFELEAPEQEEFARRIESTLETHPWLVAESAGEIAAFAYATRHRERAAYRFSTDVSVYVAASQKRRGLGRALYCELFEILREQGFLRAYAGVTLPNPASVGLHEALGFRAIGVYRRVGFKFGRWHDVGWWSLDLAQEEPLDPPSPRPLSSWLSGRGQAGEDRP